MSSSKPEQGQSLADLYPEIAKEWHPDKNGNLKPTDVTPGSGKKIWWQCSQGHEWQTTIANRVYSATSCPYCSSRKVLTGYNDLQTIYPELAKEWHPTLNGNLKPTDVMARSNKKVWWKCSKGHEWKTAINNRTSKNKTGCPYCVSNHTSYPEQFLYWSFKQIYPDTINRFKTSNKVEYDIYIPTIRLAIEYSGSNWHAGKEQFDTYKKQLAMKNGVRFIDIIEHTNSADLIIEENHYEYNCLHNQEVTIKFMIDNIIRQYNHSISEIDFDLVKQQATEYSKGKIEYKKSLEYLFPDIAKEWHPTKNYGLLPGEVTIKNGHKVWWKCSDCGYEWEAVIANRTRAFGFGCPNCDKNNRSKPHNGHSLQEHNPDIASEWNYAKNGNITPRDITFGSMKQVWWKCNTCGYEWQAAIYARVQGKFRCQECARNRRKKQ